MIKAIKAVLQKIKFCTPARLHDQIRGEHLTMLKYIYLTILTASTKKDYNNDCLQFSFNILQACTPIFANVSKMYETLDLLTLEFKLRENFETYISPDIVKALIITKNTMETANSNDKKET